MDMPEMACAKGSLDHIGRRGTALRLDLLLRRAAEEQTMAETLEGEVKVHNVARRHERHRDNDQQAEGLRIGRQDHHDEVQQVQEVIHGVLDAVDHASLRLDHILLDQLSHRQVKGPQAWMAGKVGQKSGPRHFMTTFCLG